MASAYVWHLWPGRHWPALPACEQQFVHDLQGLAEGPAAGVERMHYTSVLNALRCGITAQTLVELVPGLTAADLLAAYVHLERLRMMSWQAWHEIVEDPTPLVVTEAGPDAGLLLPVPLYRILTVAGNVNDHARIRAVVEAVAAQVQAHVDAAAEIEQLLADRLEPDQLGVELGTRLHNPKNPGLWGSAYFLPGRVGSLNAVRVAALLGERRR